MTKHQRDIALRSSFVEQETEQICMAVDVILFPGFSGLGLCSLTDALSRLEGVCDTARAQVNIYSAGGGMVGSSSGMVVAAANRIEDWINRSWLKHANNLLVVYAGDEITPEDADTMLRLMRTAMRQKVSVCAVGAAIKVLAENRMIKKGTSHWSTLFGLSEMLPNVDFSSGIFVRDGQFYSCAGEAAMLDFVLYWIGLHVGHPVAVEISNLLLTPHLRAGDQLQTCDVGDRFRGIPPKLHDAISYMYENMEEPLGIFDIASRVGLSTRQVERLFGNALATTPVKFYQELRLDRGLRLLTQTDLPIIQVALACGFGSPSNFSKNFNRKYGVSPTNMRAGKQAS